jgi:hypothetical protein
MSVSTSSTHIAVPFIPCLVSDVTPLVVDSLPLPAMRSLAQTSTRWATYLQEQWHLHQKNCADSAQKIRSQKHPELMLVNGASRLADARSITDARKFLRDFPFKSAKFLAPVVEAVLDAHIEHKSARNLQHCLQGQAWGSIKDQEIVIQKIDALVRYCELSFMEGRIPFEKILEVFASLEGRPKSYAFTHLIANLCSSQKFDQKSGEFWEHRDGRGIDFIFIAHDLLPKKWNRALALDREFAFPRFARVRTASFVSAAIITLRQLGRHSPEFGAALLRLVMTSADKFSPGCRNWKTLCSGKRDAETKRELIGIKDLISAVFYYGMPNAKAKKECKKILVGSGFFSRGDWTRFKHDAPKWIEKIYIHA